jgi:hypothetical protein
MIIFDNLVTTLSDRPQAIRLSENLFHKRLFPIKKGFRGSDARMPVTDPANDKNTFYNNPSSINLIYFDIKEGI